jgi:hypothetical protein
VRVRVPARLARVSARWEVVGVRRGAEVIGFRGEMGDDLVVAEGRRKRKKKKKGWAAAHHTTCACGRSPRSANRRCKGGPDARYPDARPWRQFIF